LPEHVRSILDIGCGHQPLLTLEIARHYGGEVEIHLMDGDGVRFAGPKAETKAYTGYRRKMRAWNDVSLGLRYLQSELPNCACHAHLPDPGLTVPCDLLLSRRSWGFHYPVTTYLGLADRSLRPGGRIVVDLRVGKRIGTRSLDAFASRRFVPVSPNLELRSIKCERRVFARAG
jgi:hypothetical protein